jgi:acylphosphatase
VRLRIEGRVQGVGFRWWVVREATRLALDGWVRNRADGSVEALAMGEESDLRKLAALCRTGPAGAAVRSVAADPAEDDGSRGFEQRPTV